LVLVSGHRSTPSPDSGRWIAGSSREWRAARLRLCGNSGRRRWSGREVGRVLPLFLRPDLRRTEIGRLSRRDPKARSADGVSRDHQQRRETNGYFVYVTHSETLDVVFGERIQVRRSDDADAESNLRSTIFGQTGPISELFVYVCTRRLGLLLAFKQMPGRGRAPT